MKKFIILSIGAFLFSQASWSQTQSITAKYDGKEQSGVSSDLHFSSDVVESAIKDKMARAGFKGSSSKGWVIYKAVVLPELGTDVVDVYTKAETKSRKEKNESTLQILIAKGYTNFETAGSPYLANTNTFIENLKPIAEAISLDNEIKAQEDVVKSNKKKFDNFVDDSASLEKKKKKIEEDIVDTAKKQAQQKDELTKQQTILDQLRSRKKG